MITLIARGRAVLLALGLGTVLAACADSDSSGSSSPGPSGSPVVAFGSATASMDGTLCTSNPNPEVNLTEHPLAAVSANPSAVTVTWLPGLNATDCATATTQIAAADAVTLARDIMSAPAYPSGTLNCPQDDGAGLELVFHYAGRADEELLVNLAGCSMLAAPQRSGRQLTDVVRHDLAASVPAGWATYFPS